MYIDFDKEMMLECEAEEKKRALEERRATSVKPEYPVYKASPLLMVRESLSIMQARFFTAYLCKVNPADPSTFKVRFSLSEFCKTLDVDTSNIKRLKQDCSALRQTGFDFIEYRRKHGEKIDPLLMDEISLFERFAIVGNYESGYYVDVTPTRPMEHLLADKERYGFVKYEAKNVLALSTKRHMRMYELFKRHEGRTFSVDTDLLKTYFGLSSEDYPEINVFQRNILKRGIKEINEKTDVLVSYTPRKRGRGGKIVGFTFTVKRNTVVVVEPPAALDDGPTPYISEEDIRDFNSEEAPEAAAPVPESDELEGQTSFDDIVAVEPEAQMQYSDDYRPDVVAQFRAIEKAIPKNVHEGNPEHIIAIHSVLKEFIPMHFMPADRLEWMVARLEQYNRQVWPFKAKKAKFTLSGYYRKCLYYWLKDLKPQPAESSDDDNMGIPDEVLGRGLN